ncbi:MAG: hypothetical protein NVSMB69_15970 [Novosphingobium sp.]
MVHFIAVALDDVRVDLAEEDGPLAHHDLMSPYVWTDDNGCRILLRVVPNPLGPTDPTGVVYCGKSNDGLWFHLDAKPAIAPGPEFDDAGGCEDPTVVMALNHDLLVYYTGVDARRTQGAMMVARGRDLSTLVKERVALKAPEGEGNIKEATVAQGADGRFRLFYEYAAGFEVEGVKEHIGASRIGMATGPTADGPWEVAPDPFTVRPDSWDNWHLSTGPIVSQPGSDPVMFYNGATLDARWRIGWVTFDPDFTRVTARGLMPLVLPPPPQHRDATDIAFAASCLVDGPNESGDIQLYYSLEDRMLRRATVRRFN